MAFDDDERSISQNRPIDLYTIQTATATYLLTSHPTDVVFSGQTFKAELMSRGGIQVTQDPVGKEFVMYLSISHPLVQRFAASGIPEHDVRVTIMRLQQVSGEAIQQHSGFVTNMSIDGHVAMFEVPSMLDDALRIKLPVIRAQRICNHVLYDVLCSVDRFDPNNNVAPPVCYFVSQTGNVVTVSTMNGHPDNWARFGEVIQPYIGQRRTVLQQVGTTLTLNAPFVGLSGGDPLTVFKGCAHDVATCKTQFNNVVNFGGFPDMDPTFAPWNPGQGLSSVQQP